MAVNENLSVSYNEHNTTFKKAGAGPDVEQESTGIAIAYTMGGATVGIADIEVDNADYTQGKKETQTVISLGISF